MTIKEIAEIHHNEIFRPLIKSILSQCYLPLEGNNLILPTILENRLKRLSTIDFKDLTDLEQAHDTDRAELFKFISTKPVSTSNQADSTVIDLSDEFRAKVFYHYGDEIILTTIGPSITPIIEELVIIQNVKYKVISIHNKVEIDNVHVYLIPQ